MDSYLCARLAGALERGWQGAQLQQAWQDAEGRLVLKLRRPGESALLLVSALRDSGGVGFIAARPPSPPRLGALAAYLRSHLVGGRLVGAFAPPYERSIVLEFSKKERSASLILEMVSQKPFLCLTAPGKEGEPVVKLAAGEARHGIAPGKKYTPPPRPEGRFTPMEFSDGFVVASGKEVSTTLFGVPPYLLKNLEWLEGEALSRALGGLVRLYQEKFALAIKGGDLRCEPLVEMEDDEALRLAGSWIISAEDGQEVRDGEAPAPSPDKARKRWEKRLRKRIGHIRRDLEELPRPDELQNLADALAASLHKASKGLVQLKVENPLNPGEEVTIPLDPALGPGANLDRLYREAAKAGRAREVAGRRLEETLAELEAGPPELENEKAPSKKRKGDKAPKPGRRFRSSDGWLIIAGRSSVENDRLVREAKPWDLWLHARDGAGAHVIAVRPGRDSRVPQRTLAEAAGLAALYSKRSTEASVEVIYVEVERVKKPKGASAGRVLVSGEKTFRTAPGAGKPKRCDS